MSDARPAAPGGVELAREIFPRGLCRADGEMGLGLDGMLLAAFAGRHIAGQKKKHGVCVELGAGSGGALLALALDLPEISGLGLEVQPPLVDAAKENALRLGLEGRIRFACLDLANVKPGAHLAVMANPPYGARGEGRASTSALREQAMRPEGNALAVFCRAGARLLGHHGRFFCIYQASRLPGLLAELGKNSLGARLALPVAPFAQSQASRVLLLAMKGAAPELALLPPLILHEGSRGENRNVRWTAQALNFCPRLACGRQ